MSYKAVRHTVLSAERYFVIPHDREIWELVDPNSRKIPDDVLAQASTWENCVRIAIALNYYAKSAIKPTTDNAGNRSDH
jgi:hypothetical protein